MLIKEILMDLRSFVELRDELDELDLKWKDLDLR